MIESTIQLVTPSERLPLCKQEQWSLQQDVAGSDSFEAHIAKMSIANNSGALKRQFHDIVVAKSQKSIT